MAEHSTVREGLWVMHVGWGMKLLWDSDASEDASKEDFCLSGLFYGEYEWEAEYGKLYFLHNHQISFLIFSFSCPQLIPGELKFTVCTRPYQIICEAWKHGNFSMDNAQDPSSPGWLVHWGLLASPEICAGVALVPGEGSLSGSPIP